MNLEKLREIASKRTQGKWERPKYGDGPLSVWCEGHNIADTHQKRDFSMGSTSCEANTTAIVAMANHIDALLDVAEAAKAFLTPWPWPEPGNKHHNRLFNALERLEAV